ncbi:probable F-box protein At3g61730 [Alnus glutinosa]|uniref:probable F-box protein At3g61730 n=1 Tax=Alnus glutinosa TaxID=3517 RepID=UPI002D772A71|nr:probable F-box protein At3g61730 [Alnus glutinosa]
MGKRLQSTGLQPDRLEKRLRRAKPICSCGSPRPAFLTAHPSFSWYEEDVWTEIAKFLDGRSLVMLALTSRWFHRLIMEDSIWKFVCLRDLQVPAPEHVAFKWINLYTSAFDGSHSYTFRQQEKHIDWMRIGAFFLESSEALLTERLSSPEEIPKEDTIENILESCGCCVLDKVKSGIWIADLQLVRCPVCDLNTCDGTMQTLDARHIELFLCEEYQDGSWEYELIGSHDVKKRVNGASAALFDLKHLKDRSSYAIFNLDSWMGKPSDWQPKATIALHAVAVNTNLQENEGLHLKYQTMRAGADGEVVSIRISQQLL